jgi:hypothetical protein
MGAGARLAVDVLREVMSVRWDPGALGVGGCEELLGRVRDADFVAEGGEVAPIGLVHRLRGDRWRDEVEVDIDALLRDGDESVRRRAQDLPELRAWTP